MIVFLNNLQHNQFGFARWDDQIGILVISKLLFDFQEKVEERGRGPNPTAPPEHREVDWNGLGGSSVRNSAGVSEIRQHHAVHEGLQG